MNRNYDTTAIEETVRTALRDIKVSDKVYCNRPKAVANSVSDFVVVSVKGSVYDYEAFGTCNISISLFAKDVENIKNGKKLSAMQRKITENFKGSCGNLLIDKHPRILGDTPDDFGFHARVILFNNVTIKSV